MKEANICEGCQLIRIVYNCKTGTICRRTAPSWPSPNTRVCTKRWSISSRSNTLRAVSPRMLCDTSNGWSAKTIRWPLSAGPSVMTTSAKSWKRKLRLTALMSNIWCAMRRIRAPVLYCSLTAAKVERCAPIWVLLAFLCYSFVFHSNQFCFLCLLSFVVGFFAHFLLSCIVSYIDFCLTNELPILGSNQLV